MKITCAMMVIFLSAPISAEAAPNYIFPISGCKTSYVHAHHDYPATDIQAKKGCLFISPVTGVISEASLKDIWSGKTNLGQDRGGLSLAIIGDDGVRYYGSHFSKIESGIDVGVRVIAGQTLAYVGNSGDAKGIAPHVHFGISWPTPPEAGAWWVRRGEVYPWKYLDAWKIGKDLSPVKEVQAKRLKVGDIPKAPGVK